MTTSHFFSWRRETFEISFLQLCHNAKDKHDNIRYDVTLLDDGHLVAALYDLSVPYTPDMSTYDFEKQCVKKAINCILNDHLKQVVTNWSHDLRRERLVELNKDLSSWKVSSPVPEVPA